jgi:hypothetical protein
VLTFKSFTRSFAIATAAAIAASATTGSAPANAANSDYKQTIEQQVVPKVRAFIADRRVADAIIAQNARFAGLSQSNIEKMDKEWRAETASGSGKLVNAVLSNELSQYLAGVQQDGQGLYTEIFVMDNKGLNVGQSGLTSDYWQGDEAKWQDTYGKGAGSMLIDEVEFDESTQTFQSQLSLPVTDPVTGEVIGAVTVGVNVDLLQ